MVKIDTASLAVTAILPAAPNVGDIFPPSPGSLTDLSGSGLAGITTVFVNGEPVPVYTNTDSDLVFQVPWNTPIGVNATFAISGGEGTPFESSVQASVYSYNPGFLPSFSNIYSDYVLASHQDFSSLVTAASPALPGEYIHLWAVGMGPVTMTLATGQAAPLDGPLVYTLFQPECEFEAASGSQPALVTFAGLAPGFVGLNQIDVQVPHGLGATSAPAGQQLVCTSSGDTGYIVYVLVGTVPVAADATASAEMPPEPAPKGESKRRALQTLLYQKMLPAKASGGARREARAAPRTAAIGLGARITVTNPNTCACS